MSLDNDTERATPEEAKAEERPCTCGECGGTKRPVIHIPRWFRKWIWFWLFLMSIIALIGYFGMVYSGKWTPDHLLKFITSGVLSP